MPNSSATPSDPLASLVVNALDEDNAFADATSAAVVPTDSWAEGRVIAKGRGILSGVALANIAFAEMQKKHTSHNTFRGGAVQKGFKESISWICGEGSEVDVGDVVMRVSGPARALLAAERTALNFLQQLSGVATLTGQAVSVAGSLQVLDTRKTVPGLRDAQKLAVRSGGGVNHRRDLADQLLLKENHFALSGLSYRETVSKAVRDSIGLFVGVEAENENEAVVALEEGASYVILDEFASEDLCDVVFRIRKIFPEAVLEVSGGISLDILRGLCGSGVTRVSIGALTHSAPSLDLSFQMCAAKDKDYFGKP